MSNFSVKINLFKLRKVRFIKKDDDLFVCIPVKANSLFQGEKGIYLECTGWQLQNSDFGDTHMVKLSVNKEIYDKLTDEQKKKLPIIGSMKELSFKGQIDNELQNNDFSAVPNNYSDVDDDLPF